MKDYSAKKIGILGGTFNPIHIGHLIIAQNALEHCNLDEVWIMPSGVSYLKDPSEIISTQHRINLVKLSIADNDKFKLSTLETERAGNTYTYDTLEILSSDFPNYKFYFICGADTLFNIEKWKKPDIIMEKAILVCALRNGINKEELSLKSEELKEKYNANIIILDEKEVEISSTKIRQKIKNGNSCKYYLNDEVIQYIKDNNLYNKD